MSIQSRFSAHVDAPFGKRLASGPLKPACKSVWLPVWNAREAERLQAAERHGRGDVFRKRDGACADDNSAIPSPWRPFSRCDEYFARPGVQENGAVRH